MKVSQLNVQQRAERAAWEAKQRAFRDQLGDVQEECRYIIMTTVLCNSITHSLTPSLPHSLTPSLTHSLTDSLIHSHSRSCMCIYGL